MYLYLYFYHLTILWASLNEKADILCLMRICICIIQLFCEQHWTKMSISCGILSSLHLTCGQSKHPKLFQHQNYLLGPFNQGILWANTILLKNKPHKKCIWTFIRQTYWKFSLKVFFNWILQSLKVCHCFSRLSVLASWGRRENFAHNISRYSHCCNILKVIIRRYLQIFLRSQHFVILCIE